MTDEECMSLPVWTDGAMYISNWKLNKEDLEQIAQTGEMYFMITSSVHPPICPTVDCPLTVDSVKPGDEIKCDIEIPGQDKIKGVQGSIEDVKGLLIVRHVRVAVPFYLYRNVEVINHAG
jgi:hypothetical protein